MTSTLDKLRVAGVNAGLHSGRIADDDPIVVCGPPRTGVRLLGAVLDGHPDLASGPELPCLITMARQWRDIDSTLGANHEKHYGVSRESTRESFRRAILRLISGRVEHSSKRRFVVQSFAAAVSVEVLAALFSRTKFILMVRDPRDVACSLLRCEWRNPRDGLPLPYTRNVEAGARFWLEFMQLALRCASDPSVRARLLIVRYEDFCGSPVPIMQRVANFLELSPVHVQVRAESAALVTYSTTDPHPPLRLGPIDDASIGTWRRMLRPHDIASVTRITEPVRKHLGYD